MSHKAIFLAGLPCSGKTHWYENQTSYSEKVKYINADVLKFEFEDYDETIEGHYAEEAIDLAKQKALISIRKQESFLMDAGSINNNYTFKLILEAFRNGFEVSLIHIETPYTICLERNKLRKRKVPESLIIEKAFKEGSAIRRLRTAFQNRLHYVKIPYFTRENLFFDMDGVLAAFVGLPKVNGKIDFVNSKYFLYLPPVTQVIDKVKELAKTRNIYILTACPTSVALTEKRLWITKHLPEISEDNFFYVNSGIYKAEMFNDLSKYLKMEKRSMCLIEDTASIIRSVTDEYNMDSVHVSEFLTSNF